MGINRMFNFYDHSFCIIDRVYNQAGTDEDELEDADFEVVTDETDVVKEHSILDNQRARRAFEKLRKAGILNEQYIPVESLSWTKRGALADLLATELNIVNTWKVFGSLWKMDAEALRVAFNKAKDMPFKCDFDEQIMDILK